jgi:hypothetical protein
MISIHGAFDSSKDHPSGVTTVAGYIATIEQWKLVEDRWSSALTVAGFSEFHLTDIKHRFGQGWVDKVRPFAKIIQDAELRSVTAMLRDDDWSRLEHDAAYLKVCRHREHACLDLLFGVLAEEVRLGFGNEPVALVFDNDWGNRDLIVRVHDAWCEREAHPGFNIFLKGGVPWDAVPLQASDLVAGLLRTNSFSRSMLTDKIEIDDNDPATDIASMALAHSRGALWSLSVAQRVERMLSAKPKDGA